MPAAGITPHSQFTYQQSSPQNASSMTNRSSALNAARLLLLGIPTLWVFRSRRRFGISWVVEQECTKTTHGNETEVCNAGIGCAQGAYVEDLGHEGVG